MARFLIKIDAALGNSLAAGSGPAAATGFSVTPLMPNSRGNAQRLGLQGADDWFLATTAGDVERGDAWDECHARVSGAYGFGAAAGAITYAEPDIVQPFITDSGSPAAGFGVDGNSEQYWMNESSIPHGDRFDWHLEAAFSGLRAAAQSIPADPDQWRVRIGHLDTGYTAGHQLLPERLDTTLQRSFVSGDNTYSAVDPFQSGFMKNPGHGTGTIGLLAGGKLQNLAFQDENRAKGDYLGGAPRASVIPVRIAPSVVLLYTSAFVRGLDYLLSPGNDPSKMVDVVSMSMGGVCSGAWTEIVNRAYDAGVVLCTAAGNHFGVLPPTNIVYPARYRRVIAVCGVMQDGRPYADLPVHIMCGCYGPQSKMSTAMAAYSPNVPWALYNNAKAFRWDGQGTSAATPQVAAAAALYIEKNYNQLPTGWARVEAVRNALFTGARKSDSALVDPRLGNGILDAVKTLSIPVAAVATLTQQAQDTATFPFLKVLTGLGMTQAKSAYMLTTEIVQLTQQVQDLQNILADPDATDDSPENQAKIKQFLSAITTIPVASKHLKATLSGYLKTGAVVVSPGRKWEPPKPPCRKLQGYVFDPSMSTQLQYVNLSETVYKIRWESGFVLNEKPGKESFAGEYLEVFDPGHTPLNLDSSHLLAQDGLEPGEASPQFRQQMVYAVGMQTIDVFESALGRLINWAQNETVDADGKVEQKFEKTLRLCPHGIQAPNAFYSPKDRAIYFGYFKATDLTGTVYPGMVYAALSHDIIAHEMTHALLDGIHKAFREPSNLDVLAFHEAFADIVALLQQFSNIDIVRSQSAAVRGDLSMESLLGNLARQFGEATKGRSALRSAYLEFNKDGVAEPIRPDPNRLSSASESHDRGALLVAAVYGAFLAIYRTRTVDLYRIASDGRSETALHLLAPDLVNRLALEASRAARHVLRMCIRAIDYCPPVDINFGDFLRAIITADLDVVPDDPLHYRVAFIESFRRWRIYPEGLQALSSETLAYPPIDLNAKRAPTPNGSADDQSDLQPVFKLLNDFASKQSVTGKREDLFRENKKASDQLADVIQKLVADGRADNITAALDLDPHIPFEITRLRFSHKTSPAGSPRPRVLVSICQTAKDPVDKDKDALDAMGVPIRWGVTLIVDLITDRVLYCIPKPRAETDRDSRKVNRTGNPAFSQLALEEPFMLLHQS